MNAMNSVTPKAAAKHDLLLNEPASEILIVINYNLKNFEWKESDEEEWRRPDKSFYQDLFDDDAKIGTGRPGKEMLAPVWPEHWKQNRPTLQ
jgi:hypothetical protein